jgi:hypothetical protein
MALEIGESAALIENCRTVFDEQRGIHHHALQSTELQVSTLAALCEQGKETLQQQMHDLMMVDPNSEMPNIQSARNHAAQAADGFAEVGQMAYQLSTTMLGKLEAGAAHLGEADCELEEIAERLRSLL